MQSYVTLNASPPSFCISKIIIQPLRLACPLFVSFLFIERVTPYCHRADQEY
ncbi:PALLD Palladin [Escherichia fergusonii B253]|nr:PALLD Palladin [Escherichia fergusonii B253]